MSKFKGKIGELYGRSFFMKINICTLSGSTKPLDVEPNMEIKEIKEKLFQIEGIPPDQQRILYRGAILPDTATVESSRINEGDSLHMVLQLRGGY